MTRAGPSRLQRAVAIGVLGLPLALGALAGLLFVEGQDHIRDLDARLLEQALRIGAVEADLTASPHGADGANADGLLAPTFPLAGARLKEQVSAILSDAGASVTGFEILPETSDTAPDRVAVRIAFSADIAALQTALFDLETARPRMRVPVIDIATQSDAEPDLSVALEVESRWEVAP